jgi:hypothetical protein
MTDGARIEVATAGDPVGALATAAAKLRLEQGGVYRMSVSHDDSCPCVTRREPMTACTCQIVWVTRKKLR